MKKYVPHALFVVLVASVAAASAIKVWTTGETLRAADLNSNFSHIHNTKVGDGIQLVNADVSASAAIAHSKLATPTLIPKGVGLVGGASSAVACTVNGACPVYVASGISGATRTGAGTYQVTPAVTRANTTYMPISTSNSANIFCSATVVSTSRFDVACIDVTTATLTDSIFAVVFFDD